MSKVKMKHKCQICDVKFNNKELFPVALLRTSVFNHASTLYPDLVRDGFLCFPDLRKVNALYYEDVLRKEKGTLTELEREVLDSLKLHEILSEDVNKEFDESRTLGERVADKIARFGGSWTFISIFLLILFSWMTVNSFQLLQEPFDPYPYILLNLVLSCLAAIQAPIIMMSQNRQSAKDRLSQESDYQVNLKSELQIRQLNARMELFMKHYWQKMQEVSDSQVEILQELGDKSQQKKKKN